MARLTSQSGAQQDSKPISASAAKLRLLQSLRCTTLLEQAARKQGAQRVAGVDEAGRGCLFGPVVAGACILNPKDRIRGLRDSKLLDEAERERLAILIRERALAWAVAEVDSSTIDRINILQASRLAMKMAVQQLQPAADFLLVDATTVDIGCRQKAIIHGDALSVSIAAASILAKVHRDHLLCELDRLYPQYGLASHKGYPTPEHRRALTLHGATPLHRRSYRPVAEVCEQAQRALDFAARDFAEEETEC